MRSHIICHTSRKTNHLCSNTLFSQDAECNANSQSRHTGENRSGIASLHFSLWICLAVETELAMYIKYFLTQEKQGYWGNRTQTTGYTSTLRQQDVLLFGIANDTVKKQRAYRFRGNGVLLDYRPNQIKNVQSFVASGSYSKEMVGYLTKHFPARSHVLTNNVSTCSSA